MKAFHINGGTMKQLKIIECDDDKQYFVDWRLRQLRNIYNPHEFINFQDDEVMAAHIAVHMVKESN